MAARGFRFQANLIPSTPLFALELHQAVSAAPQSADVTHGYWSAIDDLGEFGQMLRQGGGMASVVGPVPDDGGDLLVYLKQLRRIVEAPVDPNKSRIDGALARVEAVRAIALLRTYTYGKDFRLRPNATLEDFGPKIFKKPNALLDFVLGASYGASYKDLDKSEKVLAKTAGSASVTDSFGRTLVSQSESLGWPLRQLTAFKVGSSIWRSPEGVEGTPEEVALTMVCRPGETGSFCEGDSLKVLMKAACFAFLVKHNLFKDRADAARRYFEAQCTILVDRRSEIVDAIRVSRADVVEAALREILVVSPVGPGHRALDAKFMLELYMRLGPAGLAAIAEVFVQRPYDYRAGWPDLTLVSEKGVRFIEVKTKDRFHDSQVRFAREVAAPLGLQCEVVQLIAS